MPRKFGTSIYISGRWPLMLRLKGTVILSIWWQVLLMGVYSTAVYAIHKWSDWKLNYSLSLVSVMGMVVSLLLVFRTNTAYDRYWEGRRLWSQMTIGIRNLTRGIWVGVTEATTRDLLEKRAVINLLIAFAFATKHYLREEYGYDYDDMVDLLTHIPKYSQRATNEPSDWRTDVPTPLASLQAQPADKNTKSNVSSLGPHQRTRRHQNRMQTLAFDFLTPTNIPVELSFYIGSYIKSVSKKADPSTMTMMNNALVSLVDCLTGFERILRTPIPLAYSIHLHHGTWIYLLSLPFQLVSNLGPVVIPAVMLASFTLLGILGIGYEIENPFDDDYNDLPLDDFCKVIQAEVEAMVSKRSQSPSNWVFRDNDFPLEGCPLTVKALIDLPLERVQSLMDAEPVRQTHSIHYSRPVEGNRNGEDYHQSAAAQVVPDVIVEAPGTVLEVKSN